MSFNPARNKLTPDRQAALDSLLIEWEGTTDVPPQAARNLKAESGSEIDPLAIYLASLVDKKAELGVNNLNAGDVFQQIGTTFGMSGYEANPYKNAIFGRAILLEKFVRYLKGTLYSFGILDTPDEILRSIRALENLTEITAPSACRVYFKAINETALGRGAVFATFVKPIQSGTRPWVNPPPDANTIRNTLALGADDNRKDYILFAYQLPGGTPRVPTTASPGWTYQQWFRPNPAAAAELHGWTEPFGTATRKRPEIVHSEKDVTSLLFPIHIAKV